MASWHEDKDAFIFSILDSFSTISTNNLNNNSFFSLILFFGIILNFCSPDKGLLTVVLEIIYVLLLLVPDLKGEL